MPNEVKLGVVLPTREAAMAVSYAGMPHELVQSSLRLIGEKVVPELRKITAESVKSGATA